MNKGFTLIELIVVIILLAILSVIAAPKFINLQDDAKEARMMAMYGAIESAESLIAMKMFTNPDNYTNNNKTRFAMDNGTVIWVRGGLADGRWNETFASLVDFTDTEEITGTFECTDDTLQWCVRRRGNGWFVNNGYTTISQGRGFAIFPYGYHVNNQRCYIYYLNQNLGGNNFVAPAIPSVIGIDLSEC